ncbi:MAG: response regulator [Gammaproteobacteria bacterium]|nr:response regulator [Gammaproteobacteria bacterium]MCW8909216.1 response regulator [Gammaproteobacteria bacterium]MCW9004149.1 response regulator [Gammaproteobacteria bacterium]MCW9056617.1 response regulator [Gammaproteobacteria bacterium]
MANILIVDDSPTEIHVFKTMLEKNGHNVSVAESGEEGIEKAQEVLPDLVLMDVVMPGMNGFQATRKLSTIEATSSIPVIIVTTKDQETDKVWGIRQGAKDYIVKPVKEKDLIDRVNAALAGG